MKDAPGLPLSPDEMATKIENHERRIMFSYPNVVIEQRLRTVTGEFVHFANDLRQYPPLYLETQKLDFVRTLKDEQAIYIDSTVFIERWIEKIPSEMCMDFAHIRIGASVGGDDHEKECHLVRSCQSTNDASSAGILEYSECLACST